MWGSPFEICLINLCQMLPKQSLYYMTREEAYEELKEISKEDFGYDVNKWEQWGHQHSKFLPTWKGLHPGPEKGTSFAPGSLGKEDK